MSEAQTPQRVSRRTVAKGAAWTVPAVVVAAPAASAAVSGSCLDSGLCLGCVTVHKCCSGGPEAKYWACVTFTNGGETDVTVSFNFIVNTSANGEVSLSGGGLVPAGETVSFQPETPRTYGNCSEGSYDAFVINFSDASGSGSAPISGGSLDGGGNTCPSATTPCAC